MERPDGAWTWNGRPGAPVPRLRPLAQEPGVERIQLYQLHAPDPQVPWRESIEALAELVRRGKVEWIGISNVSVEENRGGAGGSPDPVSAEPAQPVFPGEPRGWRGRVLRGQWTGFSRTARWVAAGSTRNCPIIRVVKRLRRAMGFCARRGHRVGGGRRDRPSSPFRRRASPVHARDAMSGGDIKLDADEISAIDEAEFSMTPR